MGKCVVHPIGGGPAGTVVLDGQRYQATSGLMFFSRYRTAVCDPDGKFSQVSDRQIDQGYTSTHTYLTPDRSKLVQIKYKDRDYKLFVYNIITDKGYGVSLTSNGWYTGSGTIEYLDNECVLLLNNNRIFDVRFDESSAKMEAVVNVSAVNAGSLTKDCRIVANPFNRFLDRETEAVMLYAVPSTIYLYKYNKITHSISSSTCNFPYPITTNSWYLQSHRWLDRDTVLLHVEMTTFSQPQTQSTVLVLYRIASNAATTVYANPNYTVTSAYSNYASILNLPNGNLLVVGKFQNKPSAKEFRLDGETLTQVRETTDIYIHNFMADIYGDKIYNANGVQYVTLDDLKTVQNIKMIAASGGEMSVMEDTGYLSIGVSRRVLAFHTARKGIDIATNRLDNNGSCTLLIPAEEKVISMLRRDL